MAITYQGEIITSRQNRRIVELVKLEDRRAREATRRFRFDGPKLLCEAIRRGVELDSVFLRVGTAEHLEDRMQSLYGSTLSNLSCPIFGVEDSLFEKISQENAPEGVITIAKYLDKCHKMIKIYNRDENSPSPALPVILLESVRDPLNVGAIIRSAAALGVGELILSADCADIYHARTVRAAMGPLFSMPITRVEDLPASIAALRSEGRHIYAAALDRDAVTLGSLALTPADSPVGSGVVIGNEGHGLTPAIIQACEGSIYIPMQADTESLNAGVAAALIMWELGRR